MEVNIMAVNMQDIIDGVIDRSKDDDFASKAAANRAVKSVFDIIKSSLVDGESVTIYGLGSFKVVPTAESTARNPQTGEKMVIPAHNRVKFKAAPALKNAVNGEAAE